jgi:hypothetical protein
VPVVTSPGVGRRGILCDDGDYDNDYVEARERQREKAALREALERQIEAKRLQRERERIARAQAEEEEERRLREEQAELARRFERRRQFGVDSLKDELNDVSLSAGESDSRTPLTVENVVSSGDAFEFIKVESTFVQLSQDDESDDEKSSKLTSPIQSPTPRRPAVSATKATEPAKSLSISEENDRSDDDEPLLRQGSVKAMAKMWDTPVKSKRAS